MAEILESTLSSCFVDEDFPGTQLELFLDFHNFIAHNLFVSTQYFHRFTYIRSTFPWNLRKYSGLGQKDDKLHLRQSFCLGDHIEIGGKSMLLEYTKSQLYGQMMRVNLLRKRSLHYFKITDRDLPTLASRMQLKSPCDESVTESLHTLSHSQMPALIHSSMYDLSSG